MYLNKFIQHRPPKAALCKFSKVFQNAAKKFRHINNSSLNQLFDAIFHFKNYIKIYHSSL